jgi:protein-arginine kinase activator protein McsA
LQELHNQLQIAIDQEDYETAAYLRDEISKR